MSIHRAPVVVAIKDEQPTALSFALRAAQQQGLGLRVVHASGMPVQPPGSFLGPELLRDLRTEGSAVLEGARKRVEDAGSDVAVEYVLATTGTIDALEDEAERAGMLVLGADDLRWPDRLLGGAVATHVALRAACPVVVVPERTHPTPLSGGVVVALDGDTLAVGPLRFAYEQASAGSGSLHVLHALAPGTSRPEAEEVRANIGEVIAGWSGEYPGVRVSLQFPIDGPDQACIRATEVSELVVVGRPHRRSAVPGLARPLAAEVIRHAHCPVAVVGQEE